MLQINDEKKEKNENETDAEIGWQFTFLLFFASENSNLLKWFLAENLFLSIAKSLNL